MESRVSKRKNTGNHSRALMASTHLPQAEASISAAI
jgi:hypothetical protein